MDKIKSGQMRWKKWSNQTFLDIIKTVTVIYGVQKPHKSTKRKCSLLTISYEEIENGLTKKWTKCTKVNKFITKFVNHSDCFSTENFQNSYQTNYT